MKVAYIGGSWSSNIGNAFYNLGTQALLESITDLEVYFIPDPPHWKQFVEADFDLIGNLNVDLVILTGPCLNLKLAKIYQKICHKLAERNIKIGFISAGMSLYDRGEAEAVISFLQEIKPVFLFTRDRDTFKWFEDLKETIVYDGICTSMFLNDAVKVPDLAIDEYYVLNFDEKKAPNIELVEYGVYKISAGRRKPQETINNLPIIRTDNRSIDEGYKNIYSIPNVYHSDLPYGYLSILKNAKVVFSERVHTCASTLILGGTAQFVPIAKRSFEKRSRLFERIGVRDLLERPCQLNMEYIEEEKRQMKIALENALSSLKLNV